MPVSEIDQALVDRVLRYAADRGHFLPKDGTECAIAETLAALRESGRLVEWRPIEEAPRMRNVLLFANTFVVEGVVKDWKMATGVLLSGYSGEPDSWEWEGRRLNDYDHQPTHYADLPAPPATAATEGNDG